jgi:hypothetical protein
MSPYVRGCLRAVIRWLARVIIEATVKMTDSGQDPLAKWQRGACKVRNREYEHGQKLSEGTG